MIKTVVFGEGHIGSPEDLIAFRTNDQGGHRFVTMSFPFHEDTYNLTLSLADLLRIRNAIDDLTEIKMLGGESLTVEEINQTVNKIHFSRMLTGLEDEYSLATDYDEGARTVIRRLKRKYKIDQGGI